MDPTLSLDSQPPEDWTPLKKWEEMCKSRDVGAMALRSPASTVLESPPAEPVLSQPAAPAEVGEVGGEEERTPPAKSTMDMDLAEIKAVFVTKMTLVRIFSRIFSNTRKPIAYQLPHFLDEQNFIPLGSLPPSFP